MAKTTLRQHILRRFHANWKAGKRGYVHSQDVQEVIHRLTGKMHSTISRELRRMTEDGIIHGEEMRLGDSKVKSMYYTYEPKNISLY